MNSLMSSRMIASSLSKRKAARERASSVLPTPVGPRNMNEPIGRRASLSPARARRTAWEITVTASFWPISRWWIASSMWSSLVVSSSTSRETGTPVQELMISAMCSSVTSGTVAPSLSRQAISSETYFSLSCFSLSRKFAAVSKSWPAMASSFWVTISRISRCMARRSSGVVVSFIRTRALASSMRSMALSGSERSAT